MATETTEALRNPDRKMFGVLLTNEERQRLDAYARQHDLRGSQVIRQLLRQLPDGDDKKEPNSQSASAPGVKH